MLFTHDFSLPYWRNTPIRDRSVEFALQIRNNNDTWGVRDFPRARFLPATATTGRQLASTPITAAGAETGNNPNTASSGCTAIACWGDNTFGQADPPAG